MELETWAGEETANTPIVPRARARKRDIGGEDLSALDRTSAYLQFRCSGEDGSIQKRSGCGESFSGTLEDVDDEQYDDHQDSEYHHNNPQTPFSGNQPVQRERICA